MALVAPQHVESSLSRDRTHVPCIGRWTLNHWATRKVQKWREVYAFICCLAHWKRPCCWERWRQEEKGMTGWDGWMASSIQWTWDGEGQGSLKCCSPRGCKESDATERLNWMLLSILWASLIHGLMSYYFWQILIWYLQRILLLCSSLSLLLLVFQLHVCYTVWYCSTVLERSVLFPLIILFVSVLQFH